MIGAVVHYTNLGDRDGKWSIIPPDYSIFAQPPKE